MKKIVKTLIAALCVTAALAMVGCSSSSSSSSSSSAPAPEPVKATAVVDVLAPVPDADVFHFTTGAIEVDGKTYVATKVEWTDNNGHIMKKGDTFKLAEKYAVTLEIPTKGATVSLDTEKYTVEIAKGLNLGKFDTSNKETARLTLTAECGQPAIKNHAHTFAVDKNLDKAAACEEGGFMVKKCTDEECAAVAFDDSLELGHQLSGTAISESKATCTADGNATYTCGRCGAKVSKKTSATGHDWARAGIVEPTCTDEGKTVYKCSRCGQTKEDPIAAKGHEYARSGIVEPTCTEAGHIDYKCSRCGDTYSDSLPMKDHNYVIDQDASHDATCEEAGLKVEKCTGCGDTVETELPALGHNIVYTTAGNSYHSISCRTGCTTFTNELDDWWQEGGFIFQNHQQEPGEGHEFAGKCPTCGGAYEILV